MRRGWGSTRCAPSSPIRHIRQIRSNSAKTCCTSCVRRTPEAVRYDIERARLAGEKVKKPVLNSEIGCVARANPYDLAISEYMDAHVGYYLWELMVVWNGRGWGDVHGIFYPDGTVRDPSI